MDIKDAQEIQQLWQAGRKIEAIKILRRETRMNLLQAKDYLESVRAEDIVKELGKEFIMSKRDLLILAVRQQTELCQYIEKLAIEIKQEEEE